MPQEVGREGGTKTTLNNWQHDAALQMKQCTKASAKATSEAAALCGHKFAQANCDATLPPFFIQKKSEAMRCKRNECAAMQAK